MKTILEKDAEYICDISAPCFQALPPEEMELVRSSKTQVQYRRGDNLTKQGAFASYVLFVARGLAVQYIEDNSDKSFNLKIIQPGEFVGLSSVFSNNTFNYSSVAINDCQVLLVEKEGLLDIIGQNGAFGISLIRRYTQQRMNLFDAFRNVLYKQMMGRIAETLLYIDGFRMEYNEIFTLLSRRNLADFAGISTESMVKTLKSLEKEKVIKLDGKNIELVNKPYLEELSRKG